MSVQNIKNLPEKMQLDILHSILNEHDKKSYAADFGKSVSSLLVSLSNTFK